MAVPDYQSLMAPVLKVLSDGKPRTSREVFNEVILIVGLTDEDLRERIASGMTVAGSRIAWAVTYLVQAEALRRPRRGIVEITERGQKTLSEHPTRVDNSVLEQYEEFREFKARSSTRSRALTTPSDHNSDLPPRETVAAAVKEANGAVAAEILERVRGSSPVFLERLVLRLLTAMGYGGVAGFAEHLGGSGDGGVDGVIRQDPLGLDRVFVQAKCYAADRAIGRPEIQAFVGALHGATASRGVFVTTSRFTSDAVDYAERVNAQVILVDGAKLADLMVSYNVGVQDQERYVLKRIDEDFFEDV